MANLDQLIESMKQRKADPRIQAIVAQAQEGGTEPSVPLNADAQLATSLPSEQVVMPSPSNPLPVTTPEEAIPATPVPQLAETGGPVTPQVTAAPGSVESALQASGITVLGSDSSTTSQPSGSTSGTGVESALANAGITVIGSPSSTGSTSASSPVPQTTDDSSFLSRVGSNIKNALDLSSAGVVEGYEELGVPVTELPAQLASGAVEGAFGVEDILSFPSDVVNRALDNILGSDVQGKIQNTRELRRSGIRENLADESQYAGGRFARTLGENLPMAAITGGAMAGYGAGAGTINTMLASELGASAGQQVAREIAPDSALAELAGILAGSLAPSAAVGVGSRVANTFARIRDIGDANDIAAAQKIARTIAKGGPRGVTEDSIIEAVQNDTNLAKYLEGQIPEANAAAAMINRGTRGAENVDQELYRIADRRRRAIRRGLDESEDVAADAMTDAARDIPPSQVSPIVKSVIDGPAGDDIRKIYIDKVRTLLKADTNQVRSMAGYPVGFGDPLVVLDDATATPYVVRWNQSMKSGDTPLDFSKYSPSDLIPADRFDKIYNEGGNILREIGTDLGKRQTQQMYTTNYNLNEDTLGEIRRTIRSALTGSSPTYADENALFRSIREAQDTLKDAANTNSPNAIADLQERLGRLQPNDRLLSTIDVDDVSSLAREEDILTQLGLNKSGRNPSSHLEDDIATGRTGGMAIATGGTNTFVNTTLLTKIGKIFTRHNVKGALKGKELRNVKILDHMINLDNDDMARMFRELKEKTSQAEYDRILRNLFATANTVEGIAQNNNELLRELGVR